MPRVVGKDHERVENFEVYCPKAFTAIGNSLPGTVQDRSLVIRMQKNGPEESVSRFNRKKVKPEAAALKQALIAWLAKVRPEVEKVYQELPDLEFIKDREAELFMPIFSLCSVLDPARLPELKKWTLELSGEKNLSGRRGLAPG